MFAQDVPSMSFSLDDPPNSRLFVVAGRNTSSDFLRSVFEQYGQVSFVKYLRDKGVAYVKYDRASSAALAIENLHEVTLNDGHGPRLKVMLAESPHARTLPALQARRPEEEVPADPDNTPPRSRLFMVVPKNADGAIIEAEMSRFAGLQYCKTDLIAAKGIVFVKYATSSAACIAMESVQMAGMVAGYKVKIMLAEPKTRRVDPGAGAFLGGLPGARGLPQPGLLPGGFGTGPAGAPLVPSLSPGLLGPGAGMQDFSGLHGAGSLGGAFAAPGLAPLGAPGAGGLRGPGPAPLDMGLGGQPGLGGGFGGLGGLGGGDYMTLGGGFGGLGLSSPMLGGGGAGLLGPHPSQQQPLTMPGAPEGEPNSRLFVVVSKSATEDALGALFRCYPGMEYLDLKRDRVTGRSKGYAYVNYLTPAAAAAAQAHLNGIEFPPGTGSRLKVLFAEPMSSLPRSRSDDEAQGGPAPASSGDGSAAGSGLLGSTSPDTAAASAFQLPSPGSKEVALGAALGPAALAAAQQQQAAVAAQLSARTDPSSASHDSLLSPQSSPLHLSARGEPSGGGVGGSSGAGGMGRLLEGAGELTAGLGSLTLQDALTAGGGGGIPNGHLSATFPSGGAGSGHGSPQGSLSHGSSGGGGDGSWREPSPEQFSSASSGAPGAAAAVLPRWGP